MDFTIKVTDDSKVVMFEDSGVLGTLGPYADIASAMEAARIYYGVEDWGRVDYAKGEIHSVSREDPAADSDVTIYGAGVK